MAITELYRPLARTIFVGAETAAVKDDFLTYMSDLQAKRKLDRIVIDECHITPDVDLIPITPNLPRPTSVHPMPIHLADGDPAT